ncbi:hypothetical protein GCM10025771_35020 [Niveibacterium umoris]|uniref:Uncharacterized protein n=1 Tax=Niveibacterium umoris TaxID=1193620 RepID=A0A840BGI6_9RHOO|nr:hypothetical protein [Niveibacterium umoris]MBB4011304.1 hypothetical protein [Niveibacterium umoris]
MSISAHAPNPRLLRNVTDFSLVLGGPLFQMLRRAHLSDNQLHLVGQRIAVIALFCWLPLLILAGIDGNLLHGKLAVPFLYDFEAHGRFLVVVPLLIIAELVVHLRMRELVAQFQERQLIPPGAIARFEAALASAMRLRNSTVAELALIGVVYSLGVQLIWRQYTALDASTWYSIASGEGTSLTLAGYWFGYISLPVFQFLLLRWYFRLFIWMRFLWQVSRIELALSPIHPDRLGGLGFLSGTAYAFMPLLLAHGALLAGNLANRILYLGATLPSFKFEIITLLVVMLAMVLGPLLVFAPQLAQAKRNGLLEYGALAQRYVREFDTKWMRGATPQGESLLGSTDIQSLSDLNNSLRIVAEMRFAPITRDTLMRLTVAVLAPLAPLVLTMMPLEELVKRLITVIF